MKWPNLHLIGSGGDLVPQVQYKGIEHSKSFVAPLKRSRTRKSLKNIKRLCVASITILFLWLWSKIHFVVMAGTQTTWFLIEMNHKISRIKGVEFLFWLKIMLFVCFPQQRNGFQCAFFTYVGTQHTLTQVSTSV